VPTGIFNQGLPTSDRSPSPLAWSPSGWKDNAFYVKLCQLTQDALAVSEFVQTGTTAIPVLLFTHDAPCIVFAQSRYEGSIRFTDAASGEFHDFPQLHFGEQFQLVGNVDAAPAISLIPAANVSPIDAEEGERVTGATLTNAVTVSGYAGEIPLADQSLQLEAGGDAPAYISLLAIAQSGVVHGPNSTGEPVAYDGSNVAHASAVSCILRETDYTAAMRTAGNVYTDTNGLIIRIVGLHAIPAAA